MIYFLFLYDSTREDAWEALDDVIYCNYFQTKFNTDIRSNASFYVDTRAVVRCLEFMVALFVVCAGFHESLVGQWSWSNSAVLIVHCYFNVWQRLQTGNSTSPTFSVFLGRHRRFSFSSFLIGG